MYLRNEINKKLLKSIISSITERKLIDENILNNIDKPLTITQKSNLVLEDENKATKDIIKEEIIKIYPINKYTMYEVVTILSSTNNTINKLEDAFYFLVLLTPDNVMINCDFFDTTQITGDNIVEDDNYENTILANAQKYFNNSNDIATLKEFIRIIRKEKAKK